MVASAVVGLLLGLRRDCLPPPLVGLLAAGSHASLLGESRDGHIIYGSTDTPKSMSLESAGNVRGVVARGTPGQAVGR